MDSKPEWFPNPEFRPKEFEEKVSAVLEQLEQSANKARERGDAWQAPAWEEAAQELRAATIAFLQIWKSLTDVYAQARGFDVLEGLIIRLPHLERQQQFELEETKVSLLKHYVRAKRRLDAAVERCGEMLE